MAYPENTINDTGLKKVWDMIIAKLNLKVDKEAGKGLSTNDFTTTEKNKLSGIESGAEVNTVTSVAGKTGDVTLNKSDVGLSNVGNFKAVSTSANQGLTDTEKSNARANIDAPSDGDIASSKTIKSSVVTVNDAAPINAEDITVDITPVQLGSGTPSPDNIRPIVGRTGAELDRVGKNWLPMTVDGIKAVNTSGTWSGNTYTFNGVTFTLLTDTNDNIVGISVNGTATANTNLFVGTAGVDENYIVNGCPAGGSYNSSYSIWAISDSPYAEAVDAGNGTTITDNYQRSIRVRIANGYTANSLIFYPMIRLASITDSTYEPYQGQQYTADFGETVHGGKWHVTAGGADKTYGYVDLGDLTWTKPSNYTKIFYAQPSNIKIGVSGQIQTICSQYPSVACNDFSTLDTYYDKVVTIQKNASSIVAVDSGYSSASDFKTAMSGVQLVYELATPTTISTPKQSVPMLQGINTVYADCGDTQLKYQPDNVIGELKGEIEKSIIYEDFKWTTESSQSYSAGTPGTYGTSSWRDVKKEGYDVIGVTFVENRRFGDCILTLYYIPSTSHVEVIIFRATSSAVTIADEDIEYRVAYKKA